MTESKQNILYTIGHSNHTTEDFIRLLKLHEIKAVADVRSAPYSGRYPQFNKEALAANLQAAGIEYIFLGGRLGGRPNDSSCYENGKVNYQRLAGKEEFKQGLERLLLESSERRIAMMCAEKDPLHCHRTFLIARHIKQRISIRHILEDGAIEEHIAAEKRLLDILKIKPNLFEPEADLVEQAYDRHISKIS